MTLYDPCAAGQCMDYTCAMYGCKHRRIPMVIQPITQGCVCPPTSEQTCMNQLCPRKPVKSALSAQYSPNLPSEPERDR